MDRRIAIYLTGLLLGLVLITILPKPFKVNRNEMRAEAARATGEYPILYRDAYGREVSIPFPPQRVVSLAPSITEALFYLGLDESLAGVSGHCLYPARAANKPSVGGLDAPDFERILEVQPDLIIGTQLTPKTVYEQLERLQIPAIALSQADWHTVVSEMQLICKVFNRADLVQERVARLEERRRAVETRVKKRMELGMKRPTALILYDWQELYSPAEGTWPGDLLRMAGADNLNINNQSDWPRLSKEFLIDANPDLIIIKEPIQDDPALAMLRLIEQNRKLQPWKSLTAAQSNRLYYLKGDLLSIPGPRMILALEAIETYVAIVAQELEEDGRAQSKQVP